MNKITPCLCFDNQAEEAVKFYVSVFKNSRIEHVTRCGAGEYGVPEGSARTVAFQLFGQPFLAGNGGPHFKFSDAVSLIVNCETQEELDGVWKKLSSAGGKEIQCGWVTDKYGVSWQVVPASLGKMMTDPDAARSQRVMQAILKMVKLDIKTLERAYEG